MTDKFQIKARYRPKTGTKTIYEAAFVDETGAALKYQNAGGDPCGIFIAHQAFHGWEKVEQHIQYWLTNGEAVLTYLKYDDAYKAFRPGDSAIVRATFFGNDLISMEIVHS